MVGFALISGILKDIVAEHVMPKVIEPIMAMTPNPSQYIDYDVSSRDFMVFLCIYRIHGS
jgi:hypothetical protein